MRNRKLFWFASLFIIGVFVLTACQKGYIPPTGGTPASGSSAGSSSGNSSGGLYSQPTSPAATLPAPTTSAPSAAGTSAGPVEAEISVANSPQFGNILVGNNGMTLYMFKKDEPNKSNCDAKCLVQWPALQTLGSPKLGSGVDASLVGSTSMADGTKIVTYNGMPLYYWYKDTQAGDILGQNVGQVWFVVSPQGQPIGDQAAQASPAQAQTAAAQADINIATDPTLGQILVGADGKTLYVFAKDEMNKSNCTGTCLEKWPPLVVQAAPTVGQGLDASLVGTADLPDGTKVATYNGKPLYNYSLDTQAGDTQGEGVGGVWFAVSPQGEPVQPGSGDTTYTQAPVGSEAAISVATDPTLGSILVGNNGMTLYAFSLDDPNVSNCDATCLAKWPPLITQGSPTLGAGVDATLVGSTTTTDGRTVVTYNGKPLYFYSLDTQAGDTNGQGVGSVWFVVSPQGETIEQ